MYLAHSHQQCFRGNWCLYRYVCLHTDRILITIYTLSQIPILKSDWIKLKEKVNGPCLYCLCLPSHFFLSFFLFRLFTVLHLNLDFHFFLLLTIVLFVRCETLRLLDTSYIWFRNILYTSQALHIVTDCVQSQPLFMKGVPQSLVPVTLHRLPFASG